MIATDTIPGIWPTDYIYASLLKNASWNGVIDYVHSNLEHKDGLMLILVEES